MSRPSDDPPDWDALRAAVIGLGERPQPRGHYPELQSRIAELERFRAALDHSSDLVLLADIDGGKVSDANETAWRLLGCARDELVGRAVDDLVRDEQGAPIPLPSAGGSPVTAAAVLRAADGAEVPVEISLRVATGAAEGTLVLVARDVRERRRAEAALRASEERLRQSQKLEAIGRLAGGVAHDFNNLLTVINGYADIVIGALHKDDPLRCEIGAIRDAGERAAGITQQLLAFSRKQIIAPRVIDLNDALSASCRMWGRLIGEDIELGIRPVAQPARVLADPHQIDQILINLVVNARDSMPRGGALVVETANVTLDESYAAAHPEVRPGRYVSLVVSDTGAGMDEATRAHLFEPFFTTKAKGHGTGLGLATVYGIVKQNGGSIGVYSEPGVGTTFRVYLPLCEEDEVTACQPAPVLLEGTETVLLVEDEEMVRRVASRVLREHGYQVLAASRADEALRIAAAHDGPIDLLLTDVVMPQLDGRSLHRRLTEGRPGLRVLFMSGYTESIIVQHGVLEAGTEFLPKPFSLEGLARRVREVLNRR